MKKIYIQASILISLFSMTGIAALAQTTAQKIGTNPTSKDASALLELEASNKGFLMPRVALTGLTDVSTVNTPAHAIMVYNTATTNAGSNDVIPGFYYYNKDTNTPSNSKWVRLYDSQNRSLEGDLKNSFKTADHSGWFLLDGRAISSLPQAAQDAAKRLGFTNNLPDARDRFLKTKSASTNPAESLGDKGGTNTLTIAQANLPNITFSGTISGTALSAGAHTHTVNTPLQMNDSDRGVNGSQWSVDNVVSSTTSSSGAHTHNLSGSASVPSGGSGTTLDNRSPYLVVNTFIFLAN